MRPPCRAWSSTGRWTMSEPGAVRGHGALAASPYSGVVSVGTLLGWLRRFQWSLILFTLVGLALGIGVSSLQTPVYQASATFFAAAKSSPTSDPLQSDQYVQRRINSYVGVDRKS